VAVPGGERDAAGGSFQAGEAHTFGAARRTTTAHRLTRQP
jgi:hypothetical protein